MTEEKIKKVTALFAEEAKKIFGEKLKQVNVYEQIKQYIDKQAE